MRSVPGLTIGPYGGASWLAYHIRRRQSETRDATIRALLERANVTHFDHTSIATGMKCIPLPTRKRGAQSAEAKEEYERALSEWCRKIIQTAEQMDFKIGARDWCYVLENAGSLTKGQFDAAEKLIGDCRKDGHLPLDICAIDKGRPTANVASIDNTSVKEEAEDIVERIKDAHLAYEPFSLWENQENYVESAVEKIGLFNLFEEPTEEFHVPLTNLGWMV